MICSNMAAKQEKKETAAGSRSGETLTLAERFERDTWPELARLAKDLPEAGIHFQGMLHDGCRSLQRMC